MWVTAVSDEVGPTLAVPLHSLTVSMHTGTAYSGHRCGREFDQVASLRVEGVSLSDDRPGHEPCRHTIERWLERASPAAKRVNQRMLRDFAIIELQADERCTFIGNKSRATVLCGYRGVFPILGRERARPPLPLETPRPSSTTSSSADAWDARIAPMGSSTTLG